MPFGRRWLAAKVAREAGGRHQPQRFVVGTHVQKRVGSAILRQPQGPAASVRHAS